MPIDTTYLDADADNAMLARPALLATAQAVNSLSTSSGASLIAGGVVMKTAAISAFNATGVPDGSIIIASGRDASGDGGGGTFRLSSGSVQAANGGTVFAPTGGGRLFRDGWTAFGFVGDVNVKWFGAKGNGVTPDHVAVQAAIDSQVPFGGVVYAPASQYRIEAMLLLKTGVILRGDGYWSSTSTTREGTTSFYCHHNDAAMISFKGAIGCTLTNCSFEGSQTGKPKTGIMLGRSSAASAGYHTIRKVSICGWYTVAAIYSIASEDNYWEDIIAWNFGGDATYGLVTSTQDIFAVGGLFTSTNLTNTFVQLKIITTSPLASSAGIFMEGAESMGSWNFFGCYLTQYAGAYIRINNGLIDGLGMFGPITFVGVSGEPLAGGDPLVGIDLTAGVPVNFTGLTVTGARFQLYAGTNHYDIRQSSNVTLLSPNIVIQPPAAFPYALSDMQRGKIKGGLVSVGRAADWTAATLAGVWINTYGAPKPVASYSCDGFGTVRIRGTVQNGTGTIFTLPVELRPSVDLLFPTFAGGVIGRLTVIAATGILTFVSGTNTEVDLSPVQFKIN